MSRNVVPTQIYIWDTDVLVSWPRFLLTHSVADGSRTHTGQALNLLPLPDWATATGSNCGRGETRTPDFQRVMLTLWPTELHVQVALEALESSTRGFSDRCSTI